MSTVPLRCFVRGTISSSAFASGDRFVVGCWPQSPIGSFGDVMWVNPDGRRTLVVASEKAADFVSGIYRFDDVRVTDLSVESDGRSTTATSGLLTVSMTAGWARHIPVRRPLVLTRFVEAPIARLLMDVRTYGVSPLGVREWYQARSWRWVTSASGSVAGRDVGAWQHFDGPVNVGFSEPPKRPSIVSVRVTIRS